MNPNLLPTAQGIVVLGYGPQDMDFLGKAAKLAKLGRGESLESVLDGDVGRMAGANFAIGVPEALQALRARLEPGAIASTRDATRGLGLSDAAVRWLATGNRGTSSNTMFTVLTGFEAVGTDRRDHPHDLADWWRCEMLLQAAPELRPQLPLMRSEGPVWSALVDGWSAIIKAIDKEVPNWNTRGASWGSTQVGRQVRALIDAAKG